ncbi:MAG: hypothetical protein ABH951_01110 [Patescibacteria group bacterium]
MSSTADCIPTFATKELNSMFGKISESADHGKDPRTHFLWEDFLKDLKKYHHRKIGGILLFRFKPKTAPDALGENSFAFMLVPRKITPTLLQKEIKKHIGKRICDFISF